MLGILFYILIAISIYRCIKQMYFDWAWWREREAYESALSEVFVRILKKEGLVETLCNMINPIAGIGVEDIWISRIGNIKVKDNNALKKIVEHPEVQNLIKEMQHQNNKTGFGALNHHFMIALLQGWNRSENMDNKYRTIQKDILTLINSFKSVAKAKLKKMKESESRESIHYSYSVVFYRKYTFNLYKTASTIGLWWMIPIAYYNYKQRQPYFDSLDEVIEDLNQSDNTSPITLDDFEIGKLNSYHQCKEYLIMEENADYLSGKLARTFMWILIFNFFGPLCIWLGYNAMSERGELDGAFIFLIFLGFFIFITGIHKINLYNRLRKLQPKYILKKKGLWHY